MPAKTSAQPFAGAPLDAFMSNGLTAMESERISILFDVPTLAAPTVEVPTSLPRAPLQKPTMGRRQQKYAFDSAQVCRSIEIMLDSTSRQGLRVNVALRKMGMPETRTLRLTSMRYKAIKAICEMTGFFTGDDYAWLTTQC